MNYLYHRIPPKLHGDTLYPLNQLKTVYPDAYREAVAKYVGREQVLEDVIPILDCLWNDVIHLTPVHPEKIQDAFRSFGYELQARKFYQIDPRSLERDKTVIYLFKHSERQHKFSQDNFIPYDPGIIDTMTDLPKPTLEHYEEQFAASEQPFLYFRVPHILYQGALDTSELPSVELS